MRSDSTVSLAWSLKTSAITRPGRRNRRVYYAPANTWQSSSNAGNHARTDSGRGPRYPAEPANALDPKGDAPARQKAGAGVYRRRASRLRNPGCIDRGVPRQGIDRGILRGRRALRNPNLLHSAARDARTRRRDTAWRAVG